MLWSDWLVVDLIGCHLIFIIHLQRMVLIDDIGYGILGEGGSCVVVGGVGVGVGVGVGGGGALVIANGLDEVVVIGGVHAVRLIKCV